jgi:hypothetical protein
MRTARAIDDSPVAVRGTRPVSHVLSSIERRLRRLRDGRHDSGDDEEVA